MKKNIFGGCIIASIMCSCISSCSSKTTNNDSQVQTTIASTTSAQTEIEETTSLSESTTQNTEPSTYEKMKYNFHVETVSADSIYNTEIITMPETVYTAPTAHFARCFCPLIPLLPTKSSQ